MVATAAKALGTYTYAWTVDEWAVALHKASKSRIIGIDYETCPDPRFPDKHNALRPEDGAKICGISLAWFEGDEPDGGYTESQLHSCYCPIRHWRVSAGGEQPDPSIILKMYSDFIDGLSDDQLVVAHNIQMELSCMLVEGVSWPKEGNIHDTMVAARVLNQGVGFKERIGLKPLQEQHLHRNLTSKNDMDVWLRKHRFKPGRDIWRAPVVLAGIYAQDDSRDCILLWVKWERHVYQKPTRWWWHRAPNNRNRKDLYELEIRTAECAILASYAGNRFDLKMARRRAYAAETLQAVCTRWIRYYLDMPTINPGSGPQMRGILFGDTFNLTPSTEFMTDSFNRLPDREQAKVIAGKADKTVRDYASLGADAMKFYSDQSPEHKDLFFMIAAYKRCATAMTWFKGNAENYGVPGCAEPWYERTNPKTHLNLLFHRLLTVGTISGRKSSRDFNLQQAPKRYKCLIDATELMRILKDFLPESQLTELGGILDISKCKHGDESKVMGLDPGMPVVDFSPRAMFIPRPGKRTRTWDLSQVEMRLFAHFSGNKLLCDGYGGPTPNEQIDAELAALRRVVFDGVSMEEAFKGLDVKRHTKAGKFDIHGYVGNELEIPRKPAKGINFGIVYGMGMRKLARSLGWDPSEGKVYLNRYHARFPEIRGTQALIRRALRDRGFIFDPYGRRYYLHVSRSYVGLNRLIQGTAATLFKMGFVRTCELFSSKALGGTDPHPVTKRRHMDECMVNSCIHDEMLGEVDAKHNHGLLDFAVRSCMTLSYGLKVPLGTSSEDSDKSWDDADDFETDNYCGLAA